MKEILEIGFSEEYGVHFTCEEIPQPPGTVSYTHLTLPTNREV